MSNATVKLAIRTLVVFAFAAWQGGFFFYATFVVPVGTQILESASLQGSITQSVTHVLNMLSVVALVLFAIDQGMTTSSKRSRWWTWRIMAIAQVALFAIHPVLDNNFRPEDLTYVDRGKFQFWHGVYLWVHAGQWLAGLIWVALTMRAWERDRQSPS